MSNQQIAKQLFLNTEAWEELTDIQGEAISGGNPPTPEQIIAKATSIIENIEDKTDDKYDPARTAFILSKIGNPFLPF
ncbi:MULTISPECIES: hypothetical protein [Calothrix]|uniref:Uncharacterized protein n=2 Tax=Calothrix TaxID=1186 RepID=A0ABR8AC07_9CYAN|nr:MULTISPECIES: hypothetical protein [Calothrix]MBD2196990.1 hypothetical protein [Calothrix parietina FACHB-288]MBD2225542.1 hypothetical protein [Calothrix anomala FACHB-343]